jgi:hypothetical protein
VTVPVGEDVAAVGVTVAVRLMDWPETTVDGEAARVVVVAVGCATAVTWTDTTFEVDAPFAASAAYEAVMLWVPAVSDEIETADVPFDRADVPNDVDPSSRVTLPAGAGPDAAATVTLNVTNVPGAICVADAERVVVVATTAVPAGSTTNNIAE